MEINIPLVVRISGAGADAVVLEKAVRLASIEVRLKFELEDMPLQEFLEDAIGRGQVTWWLDWPEPGLEKEIWLSRADFEEFGRSIRLHPKTIGRLWQVTINAKDVIDLAVIGQPGHELIGYSYLKKAVADADAAKGKKLSDRGPIITDARQFGPKLLVFLRQLLDWFESRRFQEGA